MANNPVLRAVIGGITYPISDWQTVQNGQALREEWTQGLHGGMGEFQRKSPTGYYMANGFDASQFPYIRLPKQWQNRTVATNLDTTRPCYGFTSYDSNGTEYIYIVGRNSVTNTANAWKFSADGATLYSQFAFTSAVAGRPAKFRGNWYVPLGASASYVYLATTAIGAAADTWTSVAVTGNALHFAILMKDATAWLVRAHTTNNIALSSDGTNYGDNYLVGDSSLATTDLQTWQNQIAVVRPDNVYAFDESFNSFPLQAFVTYQLPTNSYAGANSKAHGAYFYWSTPGRLHRIIGSRVGVVDPSASPEFVNVARDSFAPFAALTNPISEPYGGVDAWAKYIYWARNTDLFYGEIQSAGTVVWHGLLSQGTVEMKPIIVETQTNGPTLCVLGSGGSTTISFMFLDDDGGMRNVVGTANRGRASTAYQFWYPETDFGVPSIVKQLRRMWVNIENNAGAPTPVQLAVHRDGAASNNVGSTITVSGVTEVAWTAGTSDTCVIAQPTIKLTTTVGYVNTDIRIRSLGIECVTPTVYRCVIPCTTDGLSVTGQSINTVIRALRNLRNGDSITITEPQPNNANLLDTASFTGYIIAHAEKKVSGGAPAAGAPGPGTEFTLEIQRWNLGDGS